MSRHLLNTASRRAAPALPLHMARGLLSRQLQPAMPWTLSQRRALASEGAAGNEGDDTRGGGGGGRAMAMHGRGRRHQLPSTRRLMSSPFDRMLEAFENDLGDMFGTNRGLSPFFGGDEDFGFGRQLGQWAPKVNVSETDAAIHVHAELPGVKKEDIRLELDDDGALVIRGEKKQEKKEEDKDRRYVRVESSYGRFERRIPLPEGASRDQIKAKFNDGMLEIDVPRPNPPEPSAKTITIE